MPERRYTIEKTARPIIAVETITGTTLDGINGSKVAPIAEPSNVMAIRRGKRRLFTVSVLRNGKLPPMLMKVSANMLVATATRASIPSWNITGTVMTEVLPVTTLTPLVTKNTATKMTNCICGTASHFSYWVENVVRIQTQRIL